MTRETAYRTRTIEQPYTFQQLVCDVCGTVTEIEPLSRPEEWVSVQRTIDSRPIARDFCTWACLYGWVNGDGINDGTAIKDWQNSIDEIAVKRAAK